MALLPFLRLNPNLSLRRCLLFAVLGISVLLAACGFRLKGATPLPFQTLYTNIAENSSFGMAMRRAIMAASPGTRIVRSEEHTSELQSRENLVCRLLLEKKKKNR